MWQTDRWNQPREGVWGRGCWSIRTQTKPQFLFTLRCWDVKRRSHELLGILKHERNRQSSTEKSCYILLLLWFGSRWAPSIWTERIPRSRSCWLLLWARIRSRSAASRGMLNVTRTLFQGSTFCTFSLLDSWFWKKANNISNLSATRRHGTNKPKTKEQDRALAWRSCESLVFGIS